MALRTVISSDKKPPEKKSMAHRVGAGDQVDSQVQSGEEKSSSPGVELRSPDQTDLLRGGMDKIRFGKVFGECPPIRVYSEANQPPTSPVGIHSHPQRNAVTTQMLPNLAPLVSGHLYVFCLFVFELFFHL